MSLLTGLISYYKLDGNSTDSVASNNGTDTSISYSNANGIINNGAGFNGTSSKIALPSFNIPQTYTVSMWVKMATTNTYYTFFAYGTEATTGCLTITSVGDNKVHVTDFVSTELVSTGTIGTNFTHIVVTFDGTTVKIYINGTASGSGSTPSHVSATSTGNLGVRQALSQWLSGAIDEVAIYNRAISSSEVTSLYNSGAGLQYPFGLSLSNSGFMNFLYR